jgi:molybdopterin-guanine dinucleotide biosynthesis protein MobB
MALINARVPVLGFIAPSGTGKTTLLSYVIGLLNEQGLRIGVVKQARNDFDVDKPGKDSYELRKAGIECLLLGSERQSAQMLEHPENAVADPDLDELLLHFDQRSLDLILVEGFRDYPFAKIELYRATGQVPVYHPHDSRVVAVATDVEGLTVDIPVLDINNPWAVADFVQAYLDKTRHAS